MSDASAWRGARLSQATLAVGNFLGRKPSVSASVAAISAHDHEPLLLGKRIVSETTDEVAVCLLHNVVGLAVPLLRLHSNHGLEVGLSLLRRAPPEQPPPSTSPRRC